MMIRKYKGMIEMINQKEKVYYKAYVELNEIINHLPIEEQYKIPKHFKDNLIENMDKEYIFIFDSEKNIFEQKYLPETKALFINLYRHYLTNEKILNICLMVVMQQMN